MSLSSLHLDAFFLAAQLLNFSQAAKELRITQSALSQRIKSLEDNLGLSLFIRMPRGVKLTNSGTRLLLYCQMRNAMEQELVKELTGTQDAGLSGPLRIASYSSINRSIILPALAPLLRENPNIQLHLQNANSNQLPDLLLMGSVDFIITDNTLHRVDIEGIKLGEEEYVLINSTRKPVTADIFIAHSPQDQITMQFLALQSSAPATWHCVHISEMDTLLEGVAAGLGKAVVSRNLVTTKSHVRIVKNKTHLRKTTWLYHLKQPFYTVLHHNVAKILTESTRQLLD